MPVNMAALLFKDRSEWRENRWKRSRDDSWQATCHRAPGSKLIKHHRWQEGALWRPIKIIRLAARRDHPIPL